MLLYVSARLFVGPLRTLLGFLLYFCLGMALLYLANLIGGLFDIPIALNPYTVLVAGFLNVPGVILLFFLASRL